MGKTAMRVGFIGLGTMGGNAARNIMRHDFDLVVHDIRKDAARPLIELGAAWGETPADVISRVDVVVTMVFGPNEIEQLVRGENGLLAGDCAGKTWIDLTTSRPALMRELGAAFTAQGGAPVDAPVTGSVDGAIRGDMPMFVGGDDAAVECVRPVIEAMGEVRRVGKHGNGYIAKLVNNMLWKIHAAAVGEAMVAAKLSGLEPEVWWEVMKGGAADSYVMHHDALRPLVPDRALPQGSRRADRACATTQGQPRALPGSPLRHRFGDMTVCKVIEDDAAWSSAGDWVSGVRGNTQRKTPPSYSPLQGVRTGDKGYRCSETSTVPSRSMRDLAAEDGHRPTGYPATPWAV